MAKRVFISFAMEDIKYRDFLVGQARNDRTPFEFVDMSVKEPWDSSWKTNCRTKIKGCDGIIALVSKSTQQAEGQLWEIDCSKQEGKPILGIYTTQNNRPATLPSQLNGVRVADWTWDNIKNFIDRL
jgi:hypothetical protein